MLRIISVVLVLLLFCVKDNISSTGVVFLCCKTVSVVLVLLLFRVKDSIISTGVVDPGCRRV